LSAADLAHWQANFGAASTTLATAAPEPTACGLALGALTLGALRRRSAAV